MPNPFFETVDPPYTAFRFEVTLDLKNPPAGVGSPVCNAAFAECDGLEMTMEPKTVREGGNNAEQIHLLGPISYSQLTLRRGMTANLDLWKWFIAASRPGWDATADGQVTMWDAAGNPTLTFVLTDCLPVKMHGPQLNAKDGLVAIEEMQLVYSHLDMRPAGGGIGIGLNLSAGVSVGAGLSINASASVGGSAGISASASISGSASIGGSAGLGIG